MVIVRRKFFQHKDIYMLMDRKGTAEEIVDDLVVDYKILIDEAKEGVNISLMIVKVEIRFTDGSHLDCSDWITENEFETSALDEYNCDSIGFELSSIEIYQREEIKHVTLRWRK